MTATMEMTRYRVEYMHNYQWRMEYYQGTFNTMTEAKVYEARMREESPNLKTRIVELN